MEFCTGSIIKTPFKVSIFITKIIFSFKSLLFPPLIYVLQAIAEAGELIIENK